MSDVQVGENTGAALTLDQTQVLTPVFPRMVALLCSRASFPDLRPTPLAIAPFSDSFGTPTIPWANILALIPSNASASNVQAFGGDDISTSGTVISPASPTTTGNAIIVAIRADGGNAILQPLSDIGPITITDDAGNVYTQLGSAISLAASIGEIFYLFICFNADSATAITVTTSINFPSSAFGGSAVNGVEVSGISDNFIPSAPSVINQPLPVPSQSSQGESMTGAGTSGSSLRGIQFPGLGF